MSDSPLTGLRLWTRAMWYLAGMGGIIAISPLAPTLLGLALNNQQLSTYHWLLYFSVPAGMCISAAALIAGVFMIVCAKLRRKTND